MVLRFTRARTQLSRSPDPDPERQLLVDLRLAGAEVGTVWELAATDWYPIPVLRVLIDHLARAEDPYIIRGIAQALKVRCGGRRAYVALVAKLTALRRRGDLDDRNLAEVLGHAVARHAERWDLEELLEYVRDPAFGAARIPLLNRVASWKQPSVIPDIMALISDIELRPTVICVLGRLQAKEALPCIRALLSAPDVHARGAAQRALRRFGPE